MRFKLFENFEYETINLWDILNNAPPPVYKRKENYKYVMNELKELIGKYVSFTSKETLMNVTTTKIHNGTVDSVEYGVGQREIFIKLKGDQFWKVNKDEFEIIINLTRSEINKYNL